jgi:hypothetical protein
MKTDHLICLEHITQALEEELFQHISTVAH